MADFKKKTPRESGIPTASMSDISFLLLLFFMVSTVFVKERGLKITFPKAKTIEKIPRDHAATIYVNRKNTISIDDFTTDIPTVKNLMLRKKAEDYSIIVCFRADHYTEYGTMMDIMNQLRDAEILRVSFEAKLER